MLKKLAVAAVLIAPTAAFAYGSFAPGPYVVVGGAIGTTDMSALEDAYTPPYETDDGVGRALVGVGIDMTPFLALEALYMTNVENTVKKGLSEDKLEHAGVQGALIGRAPLTPEFALFGKLTANAMATDYQVTDSAGLLYENEQVGTYLGFGGGAEILLNDMVGVRLQFERIQLRDITVLDRSLRETSENFDVDQVSATVNFRF